MNVHVAFFPRHPAALDGGSTTRATISDSLQWAAGFIECEVESRRDRGVPYEGATITIGSMVRHVPA